MKILIDNGHGKETPGKRSPVWPDGSQLYEYEFNRDIARRVYAVLTARGVDCELIVSEICDISLAERVRRVNKIARVVGPSNCLLVSIHANAGGGTGWEAWTSIGQTEADNYATIFYEEAARAFPEKRMRKDMTDGDPDKEENFYILKHTSCPTVLTENFFMDTKDDCKLIFSGSGRQRVADMHVAAIVRCIEYHNNKYNYESLLQLQAGKAPPFRQFQNLHVFRDCHHQTRTTLGPHQATRGHPHPPVLGVLRIRSRPLVPRAWSRAPVLRAPFGRMAPAGAFHLLPALRRRVGNILRISHDTRRCPRPMERRSLPRFGIRNGSLRPRERARIPT